MTAFPIGLLANRFDVQWAMRQVGHADSNMTMGVYARLQQRVERRHGEDLHRRRLASPGDAARIMVTIALLIHPLGRTDLQPVGGEWSALGYDGDMRNTREIVRWLGTLDPPTLRHKLASPRLSAAVALLRERWSLDRLVVIEFDQAAVPGGRPETDVVGLGEVLHCLFVDVPKPEVLRIAGAPVGLAQLAAGLRSEVGAVMRGADRVVVSRHSGTPDASLATLLTAFGHRADHQEIVTLTSTAGPEATTSVAHVLDAGTTSERLQRHVARAVLRGPLEELRDGGRPHALRDVLRLDTWDGVDGLVRARAAADLAVLVDERLVRGDARPRTHGAAKAVIGSEGAQLLPATTAFARRLADEGTQPLRLGLEILAARSRSAEARGDLEEALLLLVAVGDSVKDFAQATDWLRKIRNDHLHWDGAPPPSATINQQVRSALERHGTTWPLLLRDYPMDDPVVELCRLAAGLVLDAIGARPPIDAAPTVVAVVPGSEAARQALVALLAREHPLDPVVLLGTRQPAAGDRSVDPRYTAHDTFGAATKIAATLGERARVAEIAVDLSDFAAIFARVSEVLDGCQSARVVVAAFAGHPGLREATMVAALQRNLRARARTVLAHPGEPAVDLDDIVAATQVGQTTAAAVLALLRTRAFAAAAKLAKKALGACGADLVVAIRELDRGRFPTGAARRALPAALHGPTGGTPSPLQSSALVLLAARDCEEADPPRAYALLRSALEQRSIADVDVGPVIDRANYILHAPSRANRLSPARFAGDRLLSDAGFERLMHLQPDQQFGQMLRRDPARSLRGILLDELRAS